jgi:V-type H+-transporting ATPase subunit H
VQVLRILTSIIENSRDPITLAVACQDISQFVLHHPAGRTIISSMHTKQWIMRLMSHENPEVAKEAVICVQNILLSPKYVSYMDKSP